MLPQLQDDRNQLWDLTATRVFGSGMKNAVAGLSKMIGREISASEFKTKKVAVKDIPDLFGGPEALIVGVYLSISGDSTGHMLVAYQPNTAFGLVDMLLGQPQGTTTQLSDMEQSVLGEVGNIMGSFFLNYLSDNVGVAVQPSPPAVMMDMAGAVLDGIMASIMQYTDYVYVVETEFGTEDTQVKGNFLVAMM